MSKRCIYALCSWGLGHATRSLPIIRNLVDEGWEVTILTTGRALTLIEREMEGLVECVDMPDYPAPYAEDPRRFLIKFIFYTPYMLFKIYNEYEILRLILNKKKYHLIISDNRYGIYSKHISSYLITHQLRILAPGRNKNIEKGTEMFVKYMASRFNGVIVPDFDDVGISGELSHDLRYHDENKIYYIGPLSDFKKIDMKEDIDYLISISGPEPQRTFFERMINDQVEALKGKIVITAGKSESIEKKSRENIEMYAYLSKEEREIFLNRSKMVISRSGYSTVMDVYLLQKKALFIPTPMQTEQEYISEHLMRTGEYYSVPQNDMCLKDDVKIASRYSGPKRKHRSEDSVSNFMSVVLSESL